MSKRPKALVCYICGREYGTRSLEIHLKTCKKKWEQDQLQKPVKHRRPCPQEPPGFKNMILLAQGKKPIIDPKDPKQQEFDAPIKGQTVSFNEAIQQYNDAAFRDWNENVLEPCQNCGRTFLPESLARHKKSCKPGKPLKPLPGYQAPAQPVLDEENKENEEDDNISVSNRDIAKHYTKQQKMKTTDMVRAQNSILTQTKNNLSRRTSAHKNRRPPLQKAFAQMNTGLQPANAHKGNTLVDQFDGIGFHDVSQPQQRTKKAPVQNQMNSQIPGQIKKTQLTRGKSSSGSSMKTAANMVIQGQMLINGKKPVGNTVVMGGGRTIIDTIPENRPYSIENARNRISGKSQVGGKPKSKMQILADFRF